MTPQDLPKSVTVGGQTVRIVVAPLEEWGTYEHDARTITLATDCLRKRSELVSTLRHEMLHAALHIAGVSFMERYDEESIVRAIEQIYEPAWDRLRRRMNRCGSKPPK